MMAELLLVIFMVILMILVSVVVGISDSMEYDKEPYWIGYVIGSMTTVFLCFLVVQLLEIGEKFGI